MGSSPEEVAATLRARQRAREEAAHTRAAALRARLPRARELLASAGARRIWLFGSLVDAPGLESDVDLAAEGLPPDRYFEVLGALMALFATRVDLVRLEDAPPSLRERVATVGREL